LHGASYIHYPQCISHCSGKEGAVQGGKMDGRLGFWWVERCFIACGAMRAERAHAPVGVTGGGGRPQSVRRSHGSDSARPRGLGGRPTAQIS
jgi:hypothetical protein